MSEKRTYRTKQQEEILHCIAHFGDRHFTAADVAARLLTEGRAIGKATVYRAIDRLAEQGTLRKYIVDGTTAACYQLEDGTQCHEHFHLKCEVCGRLIHVECDELSRIATHMAQDHGFTVDRSKTVFYGRCASCR